MTVGSDFDQRRLRFASGGVRLRRTVLMALGSAILVAPTAAYAVNFDGIWTGSIKCTGTIVGTPSKSDTRDVSLLINGNNIEVNGSVYRGMSITQNSDNSKGRMLLIGCGTSAGPTFEEFGANVVHLTGKTNPIKGSGSLKGNSISGSQVFVPLLSTCKWTFKRFSTLVPFISPCP